MRYQYKVKDVVGDLHSAELPTALNRTYLEHRQLRKILMALSLRHEFDVAVELGMGYGRMTPVIAEFAQRTIGFEREPELRQIAASLLSNVQCPALDYLSELPIVSSSVDLVVTWTVLQHLHQDEVLRTIDEINRITKKDSLVVFCEHTAPTPAQTTDKSQHVCIGRSVAEYNAILGSNWGLGPTEERVKEATNKTAHVGTVMVFKRRA